MKTKVRVTIDFFVEDIVALREVLAKGSEHEEFKVSDILDKDLPIFMVSCKDTINLNRINCVFAQTEPVEMEFISFDINKLNK